MRLSCIDTAQHTMPLPTESLQVVPENATRLFADVLITSLFPFDQLHYAEGCCTRKTERDFSCMAQVCVKPGRLARGQPEYHLAKTA